MKIKVLNKDYIYSDKYIEDFKNNNVGKLQSEYSDLTVDIDDIEPFNFYLNIQNEIQRTLEFKESLHKIIKYFGLSQKTLMNHEFWISLFSINFYEYSIHKFPQLLHKNADFKNILLKTFDWENYIYKLIITAQFIVDTKKKEEYDSYFELVGDNLDVVNYLLKYSIFKNSNFFMNVLDTIKNTNTSKDLKKKTKVKTKKDKDERIGRKVIFEFNRDYPVIASPIISFEEFQKRFLYYFKIYF
jgi:hypothetical protein